MKSVKPRSAGTPKRGGRPIGTLHSTTAAEPFDYANEFMKLMILVNAAASMPIDLDGLEDHHSTVQAVAPLFEPTAYMRGGAKNLGSQADVLRIAGPFIRKCRELKAEAAAEREAP